MPAEPEPDPPPAAEYRVADLELFPAGDGLSLVYSRDTGAAAFYRPETVELLSSLTDFRTLDDHLRHSLPEGMPAGAAHRDLLQLSRAGFLVRRDQPPAGADIPEPAPISTVGLPTRDRLQSLRRAVTSYAENCLAHGREVRFVVTDDSPEPGGAQRCRAMLADLAGRLGIAVSHAGRAERARFAAELAEAGGIPAEVARYACLGETPDEPADGAPAAETGPAETTVGANRNSLLLHTVGERLFSADDDTVCQLAAAPGQDGRVRLSTGGDPLDTWFYPDRATAFAALEPINQDLLGLHEQFLGRPPAAVLVAAAGAAEASAAGTAEASAGGSAWADRLPPPLLRRLRTRPGRILLTGNGTVGDCGWDNPHFALFSRGESFGRLTSSAAEYRRARASRELAQAVRQPTITEWPQPRLAMCIGLDNTGLLAPFPPTGRGEEVAFGAI
ncbi:MAG TPA: hypothetical protein VFU36_04290, partial [Jatrophihabitans sp.]|nr:hypothetical protein [Jatrophihabitans sp.]